MSQPSNRVTEALDRIRDAVESLHGAIVQSSGHGHHAKIVTFDDFVYDKIANKPVELVLAFNNDEFIQLHRPPDPDLSYEEILELHEAKWPYFSSNGPLTDLDFNELRGSWVQTAFPVRPELILPKVQNQTPPPERWPPPAQPGSDSDPRLDSKNTHLNGYSKQTYYFDEAKQDWFRTVGPSLPKIAPVKGGGAEFWVGSIGVIAEGGGCFQGARGVTTYVGSAYLHHWPADSFTGQLKILTDGFSAKIGTFAKMVLRKDLK